ncbi:MAG: hypothetical protein ACK4YP_08145, partial [Myxococcota bacterium]
GQVLTGTSCGCTRDLVARNDADPAAFYQHIEDLTLAGCEVGLDSPCDCPAVDGYACDEGVCTWNYADTTELPACRASDGAPSRLQSATIAGDTLTAVLEVGGGCGTHDYTLCWDGSFLESAPVQVDLEILHVSDDMCDALITETVDLDLTPLKTAWQRAYGATTGSIVVHLQDESLTYSF